MAASSRRDFAALLDKARRDRHLSIRALASVVGVPHGTVQGWLNGKHFPTPALRPDYLRLVAELGLSDAISDDIWADVQPQLRKGPAPYLGLRPFSESDRDIFFGRARESRRLAESVVRVAKSSGGLLVVLGASGTGKSSLLAAGLIGAETVDGLLAGWAALLLRPIDLPTAVDDTAELVVVDQFEEVFAMAVDQREAVLTAVNEMITRSVVVIGMRADAFGEASQEPVLVPGLEHPFLVSPLTRSEARAAIVRPAELAGVAVDDALVHVLLDDLAPGPDDGDIAADVLPMLSNALLVTWAARQGSRMTLRDYLASGGVATALQTLAEDVFTTLGPAQQQAARALFLRLVRFSGDVLTREAVSLEEVDPAGRVAMDAFVAARMLTVSDGAVRMSHEALLHHWPRLREWVKEARVDLVVLDQLRRAARVWQDSGRSVDALIPVERIETFSSWVGDPEARRLLVGISVSSSGVQVQAVGR